MIKLRIMLQVLMTEKDSFIVCINHGFIACYKEREYNRKTNSTYPTPRNVLVNGRLNQIATEFPRN